MDLTPWHRRAALSALRGGGLVALPTEAVWGLSCDPHSPRAVEHLLAIKNRPWQKGLILVATSLEQLMPYIEIPSNNALKRATLTWPGPATWIFPATEFTPVWVSGEHDGVAVRVTRHPVLRALCQAFGRPLVSTSANPGGREPARTAFGVRRYFDIGPGEDVEALIPGPLGGLAKPTTIRDAATGHILRR